MKIFALTNDNHMVKKLPDYCCQVYAGELDVKRWGHLSALYEVVKAGIDDDIVGVNLDDRIFNMEFENKEMTVESAMKMQFVNTDMIVGPRFPLDEKVASQFSCCHAPSCLFYAYEAICAKYPLYEEAFFQVMDGRTLHAHHTFITRNSIFNDYMKWLFDILFYVEESMLWPAQDFILAFLAERLIEVYVQHHDLITMEVPCIKSSDI